jgi:WD40 repeat protein
MEKHLKENGGVIAKKSQNGQETDENSLLTKGTGDAIPREPEKLKLKGHRARITKVIFHPTYTQVATSSEDASIKLWDYETGECE